jgi:hypothetical protein
MRGFTLDEIPVFLMEARRTLRLSQQDLGNIMGLSKRTIIRMEQGRSSPIPLQYERVARALFPVNPALAEHYAGAAATTLVEMGLVAPAPPPAPATPPPAAGPPPLDPAASRSMADSIVCVAAEAMDASPRAVRPALLAAFERMKALGMGVETVLHGLAADNRQGARAARKTD